MAHRLGNVVKRRFILFTREWHVLWLALWHPRTPFYARLPAVVTLFYLLSPVDLVPDFIPLLGYADDVVVLTVLTRLSLKLIPRKVLLECAEKVSRRRWKLRNFLLGLIVFAIVCVLINIIWQAAKGSYIPY